MKGNAFFAINAWKFALPRHWRGRKEGWFSIMESAFDVSAVRRSAQREPLLSSPDGP
jgi:hypothetical protein